MAGILYVVATPIGHLGDLSERGRTVLEAAQILACEDTRRVRKLLTLLDLNPVPGQRLVAYHEHNEKAAAAGLLEALSGGADVALVSDAGTPLLSDPGFPLLRAAHDVGLSVVPIPGPSAVLALLSVCPLPAMPWAFLGFVPTKAQKRQRTFSSFADRSEALVLFESPHRILDSLKDLAAALPDRELFVGRELTKQHESFYRGTASAIRERLQAENAARGEFVLLIAAQTDFAGTALSPDQQRTLALLVAEVGPSRAAKLMARLSSLSRGELYDLALEQPRAE